MAVNDRVANSEAVQRRVYGILFLDEDEINSAYHEAKNIGINRVARE